MVVNCKYKTSHMTFFIAFCFTLGFTSISFGNENKSTIEKAATVSPNKVEMSSDLKFLSLGLKDSIVYALRNNFDIEISKLSSKMSDYDITIEEAVFDPTLRVEGNVNNDVTPINSQLVGGFTTRTAFQPFVQQGRTADVLIQSLIPTGATVSLEYNIFRDFVDPNRFRFLNPSFTNFIEAKITQPLLKGGWWFYNRSPIYIARNNKKISLAQFKTTALEVSDSVQETYWNLVKAIEDLKVAKKSLERAEDLLRKNKIQVEAGTLAPIEIIDAESGVASRVEAIISAENAIKDSEDELKRVMNLANNEIISDVSIVPVDEPDFKPVSVDLKDAIRIGLQKRPELHELRLGIENAGMETRRRKNELLPSLDFTGGIRYSGLGSVASSANDSMFSEDFQGEFFTLSLEIPIGNRSARSQYRKAKLEERQANMNVQKKELDVVVEVRQSARQVMTNIERVRATRKARELAQKRLEAEERKYEVGRTTSLEVLRAQEDLATAEANEAKAVIDYMISLGNLDKAQGTILDTYSIKLEEEVL